MNGVKIKCHLLIYPFLLWAFLLSAANPAKATEFSLFGKELNVTGYLSQEAAFAAHNDRKVDGKYYDVKGLHSAYYTAYLDSNLWLNQYTNVRMINRLMGDWIYDIKDDNHDWNERGFNSSNVRNKLRIDDHLHEIFREFYINYMLGNLNVRLGKQQVAWGQADGIRLCDIINPLDLSREAIFRDSDEGYEATRIPLLLAKIDYTFGGVQFGPINEPGIELIYNPGDIRQNRSFDNSIWQPHAPLLPPGIRPSFKNDKPAKQLRHAEWGFRLKANIWQTDCSLNFYRGYLHDPILRSTSFDGSTGTLYGAKKYEIVNSFGLTATRELYGFRKIFKHQSNPVLRLEALYQHNYPYNTSRFPKVLTGGPDFVKKDVIRYMIGFDWSKRIGFLNPNHDIFFSGQFFQFHIFNYPDKYDLQMGPYSDWKVHEDRYYATLLMNTSYFHDLVKPQFLGVFDLYYGTWWMKPKIKFELGNHWRSEVGGIFVFADNDCQRREFGHWDDRDEIYLMLKYQF